MSEARANLLQIGRIGLIATILGVGLVTVVVPAASAHTGVLDSSGVCQSDGTRLVTYNGSTTNVPTSGPGHTATLTVGQILPGGSSVSPSTQTVVGDTSFSFTQTIPGDANAAQATAFLEWGDSAKSDPIGTATFSTDCAPQVPKKPESIVEATSSADKDCASEKVTTTTVTTTTGWELKGNVWVKTAPVAVTTTDTRPTTAQECPAIVPPVEVSPVEAFPVVVTAPDNQVIVLGAEATAANPLPVAAAAGEANTNGEEPIAGGLMILAAFIALGAGSMLRRRNREV